MFYKPLEECFLQDIINQVREISKQHQTLWFRGHTSSSYKLNSGLYRISKEPDKIATAENNIYNAFLNLGDFFTGQFHEHKEWNTLFMMQHYGLYTRLLDWTSSFVTALYFANLNRKQDDNACIWVLDPIELNKRCHNLYERQIDTAYDSIGLITIDTLPKRIQNYTSYFNEHMHIKSFAMMPRRSNDRLISQNGYFTVQGTDGIPLEEEYQQYLNQCIYKIDLPPNTYDESMEYLKFNGINYYSIYGGIDGLCKYIKEELLQIKLENI